MESLWHPLPWPFSTDGTGGIVIGALGISQLHPGGKEDLPWVVMIPSVRHMERQVNSFLFSQRDGVKWFLFLCDLWLILRCSGKKASIHSHVSAFIKNVQYQWHVTASKWHQACFVVWWKSVLELGLFNDLGIWLGFPFDTEITPASPSFSAIESLRTLLKLFTSRFLLQLNFYVDFGLCDSTIFSFFGCKDNLQALLPPTTARTCRVPGWPSCVQQCSGHCAQLIINSDLLSLLEKQKVREGLLPFMGL